MPVAVLVGVQGEDLTVLPVDHVGQHRDQPPVPLRDQRGMLWGVLQHASSGHAQGVPACVELLGRRGVGRGPDPDDDVGLDARHARSCASSLPEGEP